MSTHRGHSGIIIGGLFGLGLLVGPSGCVVPTHIKSLNPEVPKTGISAAVDGGIEKFSDPATTKRVARLLESQGIQDIEKGLINGIASAAEDALSDEERLARLKAGTGKLVTGLIDESSDELAAATAKVTRGAMRGAINEAGSEAFQKELKRVMASLVVASSEALSESLRDAELGKKGATAIRDEVAPAVKEALREGVAPGMAEVLKNEDVLKALDATARAMGHGAVVGATEAMVAAERGQGVEGSQSLLARAGEFAKKGMQVAGSIAWVLGLLVLVLFAWIVKLLAQARRLREESAQRAASARLLAEGMKLSEGKPWSDEFMRGLEARIAAEEAALQQMREEKRKRGWRWRSSGPRAGGTPRPSLA